MELRRSAQYCMNSLIIEIAQRIEKNHADDSLSPQERSGFDFLIYKFTENIKGINFPSRSFSFSPIDNDIKGLGHLAKVCHY